MRVLEIWVLAYFSSQCLGARLLTVNEHTCAARKAYLVGVFRSFSISSWTLALTFTSLVDPRLRNSLCVDGKDDVMPITLHSESLEMVM